MIEIKPNYKVSLQDCKEPSLLVRYARQVLKNDAISYEICRTRNEASQLKLINYGKFQSLVSGLDAETSKPLKLHRIGLPAATAAVRFEEVFRVALGSSEFPGTDPNVNDGRTIRASGFEKKIYTEGSQPVYVTETLQTSDGAVETSYPILSTDSIQAYYSGGPLSIAGSGGQKASLTIQDLMYESVVAAASANNISVEYLEMIPAKNAELTLAGVRYVAFASGEDGNDITIEMVDDGTFGSETVEVEDSAITVHIEAGKTNAALVANLLNMYAWSPEILVVAEAVSTLTPQEVVAATNLANGADAIGAAGAEVVTVEGDSILVRLESGVSTATQLKAAVDGESQAAALVTVTIASGQGSVAQTAPVVETSLAGGLDAVDALKLGQVELSDNGSALPDDTEVEVSYQTENYAIYDLSLSGSEKAVIVSIQLLDYLEDNQA